jgi:serine/threonine-protein kinase
VYALGCVLYEMLVGEPPHTGSTPQAVLGKIITEAPPQVTKARKTVPPNVEAAVARALEKLPADRFRDAAELAKALVDPGFRHGLDGGDRYALTRTSRVAERLLVPLTLATLLLGGLTVRSALQPTPSRPVVRFSIPVDQAFEHGLAISPDGSTIVLGQAHSSGGGAIQFEQRRLESLAVTPIPGTEGQEVWSPSVSPDGSEVAFHADGEIRVTPLGGGASRTIAGGSCCPFWAQDGSIYFQEPNGSIQRVESPGGPARSVTNPREGERHGEPWLLSGGEMGVLTVSSVGEQPRIESVNLSTGERQTLATGFTPQVTASGHLLFGTLDGQLMAAPIDLTRAELEAPPVAVVEGMAVAPQQFVMYDVSESGTLVYLAGTSAGRSEFVWANRSGQILPVDPGETFGLIGTGNTGWQLSPDDSTVAFRQLVDGKAEIWTKALPDGPLSRLTFGTEADVMRPTWTPDGEWVTYFSGPDAQDRNVWRRRADGVGEPELVYDGERSLTQGVWCSDGQWLILRTGATAAMGLGLRDIVGLRLGSDTTLLPLVDSEFVEGSPSLSPDGRWLAYESDETGQFEIYVRPFPNVASTRIRVSSNGGLKPVWAHSGRELFFADASGYMVAAEFDPEEGRVGELDSLFQIPGGVVQARGIDFFDVSSDDQRFLMVRSVASGEEGLHVVVVQNFFEELKRLVPPN